MPSCWINGQFLDENEAQVAIDDAGLLHGAGLFTTMRARGGGVERLDAHLRRLRASCDALFVPLKVDDAALTEAANALLEKNELSDARMRLTVTRGSTTRDPLHGEVFNATTFITAAPLVDYPAQLYERGLTVVLESDNKLNPYDMQAGHKTLDYFGRFAALRSATKRSAGEALWFNVHNFLQSGSISNVFITEEQDGRAVLLTPPTNEDLQDEAVRRSCPYPKSNVLPGVTRAAVVEQAKAENIPVQRLPIDINRLLGAREVFLTNSIMGVMPVTRIEQSTVGDGQPGELTRWATGAL